MLNELKVNHMGGADNYGSDDFYNIDDAWRDTKKPIKPKVRSGNKLFYSQWCRQLNYLPLTVSE